MSTERTVFGNKISTTRYRMSSENKNVGIASLTKMNVVLEQSIKEIKDECTELANEIVSLEGKVSELVKSVTGHNKAIDTHDKKIDQIING
jgi:peptidoglycan hydrolase CwlO-like protein